MANYVVTENSRKKLLIKSLENLGETYAFVGKYEEALDIFQKMLRYAERNHLIIAKSKIKIAGIYDNQGKIDDAMNLLLNAEKIVNKKFPRCPRGIVDELEIELLKINIHFSKAWIYFLQGQNQAAIDSSQKGVALINNLERRSIIGLNAHEYNYKIQTAKIVGLNTLGTVFFNKGKYNKAIEVRHKALKISKKIGNKFGVSVAIGHLGNLYHEAGNYDKAKMLYQRKLEISTEIGDKEGIGIANAYLGFIYQDRFDHNKAIEYYQEYLRIMMEIGDKRGIGMASEFLGSIYYEAGDYDKAIKLYKKSIKIAEQTGDRQGIAYVSGDLGLVYLNRGDYRRAKGLLQKLSRISEEIGDKKGIGMASLHLAEIFLNSNQTAKARHYLLKSKSIFKEIGYKQGLLDTYLALTELEMKISEKRLAGEDDDARSIAKDGPVIRVRRFDKKTFHYFALASRLVRELKSKKGKAQVMLLKARIGMAKTQSNREIKGQTDEKFKEAIKIFEELRQPFELAKAYYYYGEYLLRRTEVRDKIPRPFGERAGVRGQEEEKGATEYLQKAKEIFEKIGAKFWFKKVNELWNQVK
uniref:Tetratricopeptide repeat protein n=1 Tax=candidate division WOR-3 bacterium TaxID=2052148 RepID=A0A7C4TC61_UNCW3